MKYFIPNEIETHRIPFVFCVSITFQVERTSLRLCSSICCNLSPVGLGCQFADGKQLVCIPQYADHINTFRMYSDDLHINIQMMLFNSIINICIGYFAVNFAVGLTCRNPLQLVPRSQVTLQLPHLTKDVNYNTVIDYQQASPP